MAVGRKMKSSAVKTAIVRMRSYWKYAAVTGAVTHPGALRILKHAGGIGIAWSEYIGAQALASIRPYMWRHSPSMQ
jgi:hypothetical protein